ncbi:MAG: DUF4388 domain-containing protein [Pyrinomonadaceae bacterium]
MPLSGDLSDLSLSELIEFFCNQRKTGQLKVLYPQGHGHFYLQTGSVVDARIGVLRGIEAVYYALTLPNAKFEFSGSEEPIERTINQPWTQVVLEGLRRLDEGVVPANAFPAGYSENAEPRVVEADTPRTIDTSSPRTEPVSAQKAVSTEPIQKVRSQPIAKDDRTAAIEETSIPSFLSSEVSQPTKSRKAWVAGAVAAAVLASIAAIGVPAGWYGRKGAAPIASQPAMQSDTTAPSSADAQVPTSASAEPSNSTVVPDRDNDPGFAAKRQQERERARAREGRAAANQAAASLASPSSSNAAADSSKAGPKKVTVSVTYDESGRVTQASGSDATAVRIARQKRFPAGKAGSTTITIPIN